MEFFEAFGGLALGLLGAGLAAVLSGIKKMSRFL